MSSMVAGSDVPGTGTIGLSYVHKQENIQHIEVQYELNEYLASWSLDGEDKDYLGFLLAVSLQVAGV